jgi:hypothetical protein
MSKSFLIYEEMRKYFTIYEEAVIAIYDFAPDPSEFPYIGGKFYYLFYQCVSEEYMYTTEYLSVRELQPV